MGHAQSHMVQALSQPKLQPLSPQCAIHVWPLSFNPFPTLSRLQVPISIGMLTSFLVLNWTSALDYTVGAFFLADLIVSFHVGFIATYNLRKVLVLNGKLIAKFYMQHVGFGKGRELLEWVVGWVSAPRPRLFGI